MSKLLAWSHSRKALYRKCPYWFWAQTVAKPPLVKFEDTAATLNGTLIHKLLEKRVSLGVAFAPDYMYLEPIALAVLAAPGKTFTEVQMSLDADFKPCGYKDWDNCYIRGIADVLKIGVKSAFAGDYKTGKRDIDEEQLMLMAAMLFEIFPELERVTAAYIWTPTKQFDKFVYERKDLDSMWERLMVIPRQMQEAYVTDQWKKRPGVQCQWCPVNKAGLCDSAATSYGRKRG